jgi:hypothetical protein
MNESKLPFAFSSSFIIPHSSFSFHSFAVRLWCERYRGVGVGKRERPLIIPGAAVGTGVAIECGDTPEFRRTRQVC